ncbi:transposase family protein [Burkholderia mallei]|nr:transposase family protein [Burkholderia mallei]
MKKRFTEQQIIGFLKEAEAGMPVKELCRKHGFSDASFYTWRAKFGGMEVSEARRLKDLEVENARLKKLLAEAMFDMEALKVVVKGKPLARKPNAKQCWRFGRRSTSPSAAPAGLSGFLAASGITTRSRTTRMRCSRRVW